MGYKRKKKKRGIKIALKRFVVWLLVISLILVGCDYYFAGNLKRTELVLKEVVKYGSQLKELPGTVKNVTEEIQVLLNYILSGKDTISSLEKIPDYQGTSYVIVNDNMPVFTDEERKAGAYEFYSELDYLGRCGYVEAKISPSMMPTEPRDAIGMIKPAGWHTIKYDIVDGRYLYNRCHLIGYQLTGENANEKNLITGTRYLNVEGMLPWENKVADYIQQTGDSVLYRVTPIYEGKDLVARGLQMEAESLGSREICFNIFVFNVQPGIGIDYSDGSSWLEH